MFTRNTLVGLALAGAIAVGALEASSTQSNTTIRRGFGVGSWDLPVASAGQGAVDGIFYIQNVPNFSMHFTATLTDIPSACLSCIGGTLQGTLDDGIGPGPDYTVDGEYHGAWLSGKGQWTAVIHSLHLPQTTPVGRVRGVFDDPPPNAGPGTFACRWVIND